jgi:cytidine deaminase
VTPVRDAAADASAAALAAMRHAYAPYSHFRVGAALRATDGTVVAGCNVENAAFPSGTCAERGALAAAVAGGHRQFDLLVVATDAGDPTPPCGMCRQALMEFSPALRILAVTTGGKRDEWLLSDLLPQPFTPASLSNT